MTGQNPYQRVAAERDHAIRKLRQERAAHKKDLDELNELESRMTLLEHRPKTPSFALTGVRADCPCFTGATEETFARWGHARCFHCTESFESADAMQAHVKEVHHG
jgi:hypothetical protein